MKNDRFLILAIFFIVLCGIGIVGPFMPENVNASGSTSICDSLYSQAVSDAKKAYGKTTAEVEKNCMGLYAMKQHGVDPSVASKCVDLRANDCLAVKFMRGDANGNGLINETIDLQIINNWAYNGQYLAGAIQCLDAYDRNDDGKVDISDGGYLSTSKVPYLSPGTDPTKDSLRCDYYPGNLAGETFPTGGNTTGNTTGNNTSNTSN
jgi:hypothetical protein